MTPAEQCARALVLLRSGDAFDHAAGLMLLRDNLEDVLEAYTLLAAVTDARDILSEVWR